jgi:hypothetical protein
MPTSNDPFPSVAVRAWMKKSAPLSPLGSALCVWVLLVLLLPEFLRYQPKNSVADLWFLGWIVSVFCLWYTLLWNLAFAVFNIADFGSNVPKKYPKIIFTVFAVVLVISLLDFIIPSKSLGGARVTSWQENIQPIFPVVVWSDLLDIGALIVLAALIYSLICLCSAPRPLTPKEVALRSSRFQMSLYSCALLLIFELLEIFTQYNWGIALSSVCTPAVTANCTFPNDRPLSHMLVFSAAVLSSLLLVVMYFPVSAVQSGWRDDLLSQAVTQTPELDEKQWLAAHGLSRSPWKSFIAMITPLLTASTTEIIKHFSSSL